jgi:cation transport ATPase
MACAVTWWITRDPVRLLAVLVVATPCPLLLATPVAMIAGLNSAARRHLIIRHGGALEALSRVTVAVFDKTGTLTIGKPRVVNTVVTPGFDRARVLQLAAAVEHGSGHLLARTLVEAATLAKLPMLDATDMVESPGAGITGRVGGHRVTVGALPYVLVQHPEAASAFAAISDGHPGLRAYVAVDGQGAGYVEYADVVRPGMRGFIFRLRSLGVKRILLLSGDSLVNVASIATAVGIDEAHGDLLPSDKVATVQSLMRGGERTLMVGDGTNDAPALSAATVGVALASGGSGISAEAADVVILGDDPVRIAEGIEISRRTMRIARQSIWGGLGLSAVAMVVAALGFLPPATGALVQEAIDVAVILNALRAAS